MFTEDDRERRNMQLRDFFRNLGYADVKVIGNKDKPAVVLNKSMALALYVDNFDIVFTTKRMYGDRIFSYRIGNSKKTRLQDEELSMFLEWMATAEHDPVYVIAVPGTNLKYCKQIRVNGGDPNSEMFSIFSEENYSLFLSEFRAQEKCDEFSTEKTPLEVYAQPVFK